ncbi:MAG: ABC transporter substrate-binding protein [Halodesulfurarchaeum sp.]
MSQDSNEPAGNEERDNRISRRTYLATGTALTVGGLAGCAGGGGGNGGGGGQEGDGGTTGTPGGGTVELELWSGAITESQTKRNFLKNVVSKFEAQNQNVRINLRAVPRTQMITKMRSKLAAGNPPHMVQISEFPNIYAGDVGMDIDPYFEGSKTQQKVNKRVIEPFRLWGQQLYGENRLGVWPLGLKPYAPVWRGDWLESAGLSRSDVVQPLEYSGKLGDYYSQLKQSSMGQQSDHFPSMTPMKREDVEALAMYIPQFGGSKVGVITPDGNEAAIDTQAARDAIRMQTDFIDQGYFDNNALNMGDEEGTSKLWAGELGSLHIQDSGDIWTVFREDKPQMMDEQNPGFAFGLPHKGTKKLTFTYLVGVGFAKAAFDNDRQRQVATDFADFWAASEQFAVGNANKMGMVPINPGAIRERDWFGSTQLHKEFWRDCIATTLEEYEFGTQPAIGKADQVAYEIPSKMYQRILNRGMSVEEATSWAAEEINAALQK